MGFGNSVGGAAHGFLQLVSYGLLRSGSQQPLCLFSAPAFIEEFLCPLLDFNIPFPASPTYSFLFIWVGKEYSEWEGREFTPKRTQPYLCYSHRFPLPFFPFSLSPFPPFFLSPFSLKHRGKGSLGPSTFFDFWFIYPGQVLLMFHPVAWNMAIVVNYLEENDTGKAEQQKSIWVPNIVGTLSAVADAPCCVKENYTSILLSHC